MILPAVVLNDYQEAYYATMVYEGRKTLETRMKRMFKHRGDLIICCGASSVTENAGLALCVVNLWKARPMRNEQKEIEACGIEYHPDRKVHLLKDWRYFSRKFKFSDYAVQKNFQGVFKVQIPDDVIIIPMPEIKPFEEIENELEFHPL